MNWQTARFLVDLSCPRVMGIVNVTPDSFSDGGQHASSAAALKHCELLIREGADILDIGGESSRPGAVALPLDEELARVLPVVRGAVTLGVPVSVDTCKPRLMQAVLDLGADIINDIWALRWRDPLGASDQLTGAQVIAQHAGCGVCLMHMHREPLSMQLEPMQGDVLEQVLAFLIDAARQLLDLGVARERIVVDPGIGFGKTVAQNFSLLKRQNELLACGYPLLAGWSRKSSLGTVTGVAENSQKGVQAHPRMVASIAAALLAVERGASIVRVHDVRETVQALKVFNAIK